MSFDANYPELGHTSQIKGTVLHKTALTQTPAASSGISRPLFNPLTTNSGVPTVLSDLII